MYRVKAKDSAPQCFYEFEEYRVIHAIAYIKRRNQDFELFINEELVYESAYPFERVALTEEIQDKVQDLLDCADIMNVLMD